MGLRAGMGPWLPDTVYNEIRRTVKGYDIPLADGYRRGPADDCPSTAAWAWKRGPDLIRSAHDNSVHVRHARDGILRY